MRKHPSVYEINTRVWLGELTQRFDTHITLANIPAEVINELAAWGFDAIWMMGVWERSPAGVEIALKHPGLRIDYDRALPGWTPAQVIGSPYAVRRYVVDERLGGREGLAAFREQLRQRGMGLILDYVPNHTALDHPWTLDHPDYFINGTALDLQRQPESFYRAHDDQRTGAVLAHGRDPYFPAWGDTAQVNAFSPAFRQQTIDTLRDLADQCDGVRCDMAMLLTTRIFAQTWGALAGPPLPVEFWQTVIPAVRQKSPAFLFIAEVYWDMESEMQAQGFDFTYDKRLYDRLAHEPPHTVRDHLLASLEYQTRMVRFIENHDEPRAAATFGEARSMAAATVCAMLPGMKLFYEGQLEGRTVKLPVQLAQRPAEPLNPRLHEFYRRLLGELRQPHYHEGVHLMLAANPALGQDRRHEAILAFAWALGDDWRVVVVNLSGHEVAGRVMVPNPALAGKLVKQTDLLNPDYSLGSPGDQILNHGLGVRLAPHEVNIFGLHT
jgi:glycosidase